ncbi:MAG: prolipoprotein diacylglyceryl transferase [Candidatus Binatia bacterium]
MTTYGVVLAVYFSLALPLTVRLNARRGIAARITATAFALGVPAAIVGARLLDVVEYWGRYHSLADVVGRTGSSIYGAFFAAFAVVGGYLRSTQVSQRRFLDGGAPAMALGEACSRVGCFLDGCCYGVPWTGPWAVVYAPSSFAYRDQYARGLLPAGAVQSLAVHPVQLYSAAIMLGVFAYLLRRLACRRTEGEIFCRFLVAYGVLRLAIAPLRMEALPSMKVFSVIFIAAGLGGEVAARRDRRVDATRASTWRGSYDATR